jgi:hypothetical protein
MHDSAPAIAFVAVIMLMLVVYFFRQSTDEDIPLASQSRITVLLLSECPMLKHFVSARSIAKRHNLDIEALESVLYGLTTAGILERRYKRRGWSLQLQLYRRVIDPVTKSPHKV